MRQRPPASTVSRQDRHRQGCGQQLGHAGDDPVAVDRLRDQRLLTREGEQAVRQPRRALRPVERAVGEFQKIRLATLNPTLQEVQVADHDRQHVVEVMCDPAGELADRLQLLRLPQLSLDTFLLLLFVDEPAVCRVKGLIGLDCGGEELPRVPQDERSKQDRETERAQGQQSHALRSAQRLRLRLGEGALFLGVDRLHRLADAIHVGLAAIRLHERQRLVLLARAGQGDRLPQFGDLRVGDSGDRIECRHLAPVAAHDLPKRFDFAVDRRESSAVGFEVGLPVRQQVAALTGLCVLQQGKHPTETKLDPQRALPDACSASCRPTKA